MESNEVELALPAELTDEIIGWISESPAPWKDLSCCSLVCKAWLPASRSHLFHSIRITLDKATRWNDFLKSSHLTSYLRQVEIVEMRDVVYNMTYQERGDLVNKLYDLLPQLAQLVTVATLIIDVLSWVSWEDIHIRYLCSAFRNITALELRTGKFHDNQQLMLLLRHFPLLERLYLVRIKAKPVETPAEEYSGSLSPALHTLKIAFRKAILGEKDWLCKYYPLVGVRHLELYDILPSEVASAGHLMRHLQDHLLVLGLSFDLGVDTAIIPEHFQPRHNPNLRDVRLKITLDALFPSFWDWMCHFLSSISSSLRRLSIEINAGIDILLGADWSLLARALDGPQFSVLQEFHLVILPSACQNMRVAIQQLLPSIYSRGIIDVIDSESSAMIQPLFMS
ncbi:hypothetical protein B0H10DRAFT_976498 [Mycena sp. CBHHK59/15]|nr:hypothetical protein B0H10DRAFT_976498 [Mycena sp. CBHHK59/15]